MNKPNSTLLCDANASCRNSRRCTFRNASTSAAAGFLFLTFLPAGDAQEIPRPSTARQKAQTAIPSDADANFKIGQVQFRFDAGLNTEYVDNVNQQSGSGKGDVAIYANLGVGAVWPLTKLNTLRFRASVGYPLYRSNSSLNEVNVNISPDTALSFDVYTGDFRINFHDSISVQNDLVNTGTSGGVAQLPRLTNTIGANVLWDLNEIILTLGYDHLNFLTLGSATNTDGTVSSGSETSGLDHVTDQFSTSASFKMNSITLGGVESTWSYSYYPNRSGSDFSSFSIGPFVEYQITQYTHIFLSGGFREYSSNNAGTVSVNNTAVATTPGASAAPAGGSGNGYYVNASIVHRLNRYYSDTLAFGHSDNADALSGRTQTNFVNYTSIWSFNSKLALSSSLFFNEAHEITGNAFGGGIPIDYQLYGCTFGTGYRLTEHASLSLAYAFTKKRTDVSGQGYRQNRVSIGLGYRF